MQQNGTSAEAARSLAGQQWAECNVLAQPLGEELCQWASRQNSTADGGGRSSFDFSGLAVQQLLSAFLGNATAADAQ